MPGFKFGMKNIEFIRSLSKGKLQTTEEYLAKKIPSFNPVIRSVYIYRKWKNYKKHITF